jgi:hypothetical protein
MITLPTVFLLGAGASQPFGLPIGNELRQNILDRYSGPNEVRANILTNTTQFGWDDIHNFLDTFGFSGLRSVDAFLEHREEFMEIGKATMGIELLHGELHKHLWRDDGQNWLLHLYGSMVGNSLEEFAENKVSFVTFNYDRSVEHFLFVSLKNTFRCSDEETAAVLGRIPVVHLHGRLGYLPWQNRGDVIAYGDSQIDKQKMKIVTRLIKVVHEDLKDGRDEDFALAKKLLREAERGYALGFGFGTRNVQRLDLANVAPKSFLGTCDGMTSREAATCSALVDGKVGLYKEYQCLEFLREIAVLN